MTPRFLDCFAALIGHEAGYVNNPRDPGGETKYGISKRSYPQLDIANLTLEQAQGIYWTDFWLRTGCPALPVPCDRLVFDAAVNHGQETAIRLMQRALHVSDDGRIGPITIAAAKAANPDRFAGRFMAHRLLFWADINAFDPNRDGFGRGWTRRGAQELLAALDGP